MRIVPRPRQVGHTEGMVFAGKPRPVLRAVQGMVCRVGNLLYANPELSHAYGKSAGNVFTIATLPSSAAIELQRINTAICFSPRVGNPGVLSLMD